MQPYLPCDSKLHLCDSTIMEERSLTRDGYVLCEVSCQSQSVLSIDKCHIGPVTILKCIHF